MSKIKFSIAIPAYKHLYLKEAIESILLQSYPNYEIIIVNDASPYDLDSIVLSYGDDRIKYFKNERNCGAINVVDNWNLCLRYATGNFLICMGDDDKLLPNCLEEYINLIKKYPSLYIYHAWTEIIDEKSNVVSLQNSQPEWENVYSLIWHRWNGRVQYIGDFLYNVNYLRKCGGFYKLPLAWGSDEISANISAKEFGIANTQVPIFQYRVNSHTITKTGNVSIKLEAIMQEKQWYDNFLLEVPTNHIELVYWNMLKNEFKKHFEKKIALTISEDLRQHSIFKILYWWRMKHKYYLSYKGFVYALIQAYR